MHPYIAPLHQLFSDHCKAEDAASMKAYMKDRFEYFGIRATQRRELTRAFYQEAGLPDRRNLDVIVKELWKMPQRELHYVAQEMVQKVYRKMNADDLDLLVYLASHNSWWDTVDFIAAHLMGTYFKQHPENITGATQEWMNSGNLWLQRCVLLFQLKYKKTTDTELLFDTIRELKDHKDFFIRKAIGWVLREYSKTDAHAVAAFLETIELSPLSIREASKYL